MSNKTILVIEDEPDVREMLKIRLENEGYNILEAEDGLMGLNMAKDKMPDLILLDILLPKLDGFRILRLLKFDEKSKKIPVIILSAKASPDDIKMGSDFGANDYITKPYKSEDLLKFIKSLIGI